MRFPPLPPAALAVLVCPLCGAALDQDTEAVLVCGQGHRFDRARQGPVTLLAPRARLDTADSAAMVAAREAFLGAGHYDPVSRAVALAAAPDPGPAPVVVAPGRAPSATPAPAASPGRVRVVVDVGGGTGRHLAAALDADPGSVGISLDASRHAARRAAGDPRIAAVVADAWSRWPLAGGAIDAVLVVFSPRNAAETARVLHGGGRLVVVTPTADHLGELRERLGLLDVPQDKAERVADAYGADFRLDDQQVVRHLLRLTPREVQQVVAMGPTARHVGDADLAHRVAGLPDPTEVTLAVTVSVLTRRDRATTRTVDRSGRAPLPG